MINLSQSIFYDDLTLSIMYIVTSWLEWCDEHNGVSVF